MAHVVTDRLDVFERLYRIIGFREHRVDAVYRLAEQHRTNLGKLAPSTAEQAQDAKFEEVDAEAADGNQLSEQRRHED